MSTPTEEARDTLRRIYRDYYCNYLTPARYAECNGLTEEQATKLLELAREVENSPHPES